MAVDEQRLDPIGLGMGAAACYSGTDVTSPRTAVLAGEVPYLASDGSTPDADPVLELRIHGVGGAPPPENLQSPATIQVAGDDTAGFYRAWYPGGSAKGRPRREAYCWGGLNTRASSRALYLLLIAFMLVNVAHWALPGRRTKRADFFNDLAHALLRILALALTVAFIGTTVTAVGDLVAWQAPARGALPSWLGWYARRDTGPRLAVGLLVVLAVLGAMVAMSVQTARSYERWGSPGQPDEDPEWPLTRTNFWRGELAVNRQRNCHAAAASAVVLLFAALPDSSNDGLRVLFIVAAGLIGAVALGLVASPWTDRNRVAGTFEKWSDSVCRWFARAAVALATGVAISRFWWRVDDTPHALPGDQLLQVCTVFAEYSVLVLIVVAVVVRAPWKAGREVLGFGLAAPMLAALAATISTIFGASLTLAVSNLIGTPRVTVADGKVKGQTLLLPSTVYAGGLGMVVALAMVIGVGGYLLWWSRWETKRLARVDDERDPDTVLSSYPQPGGDRAREAVAGTWARSQLTDHAATALTVVTVPTAAVLVVYLICLQAGANPAALARLAAIGGVIGVAATLYFLTVLRTAFVDATKRKRFGLVWDVGTFWPRACHPFGPPCYAERSVPEVVARIRRMTGDRVRGGGDVAHAQGDGEGRGREPDDPVEVQSPVLLTGYSQGTPISVAVMAQLPQDVRARMSLLTLAAPIRRLYGRAFPAYFGPDQLARLQSGLTDSGVVRWRNLVRHSDYIGGWAFEPSLRPADNALVDRVIHDPPALWGDKDPSPPATHLHSDWFPDPQTRPYAVELAGLAGSAGANGAGGGARHAAPGGAGGFGAPGDGSEQLAATGHTDKLRGTSGNQQQD
jgi:hypothetical protein